MIEAAAEQWKANGWVLLDGLIPTAEIVPGYEELLQNLASPEAPAGPTRRADESPETDRGPRFRGRQFDGTTLFPYPDAPLLNRLFVHPRLIDFATAALETTDLRIYQSRVWSKFGDHTNYEQPHHIDGNHSLVPIRQGAPWGHVECFVYLHDVDERNGAPRLVPAAATDAATSWPGIGGAGTGRPIGRDEAPHLYDAEVSAAAGAGSVLAYRSDVWHRGIDIPAGAERHIMVVAFRPAQVEWIGFDAHAPLVNRPDFVTFAEACTPEELALFGVPRPGHEFWTADVLDAMARAYPRLDLAPWRAALAP